MQLLAGGVKETELALRTLSSLPTKKAEAKPTETEPGAKAKENVDVAMKNLGLELKLEQAKLDKANESVRRAFDGIDLSEDTTKILSDLEEKINAAKEKV